jgi:hypothetical protein
MDYLMTQEQQNSRFSRGTSVDVAQSDIRPVVRGELVTLQRNIRNAVGRSNDQLTRYHLMDALERIDLILNPIAKG